MTYKQVLFSLGLFLIFFTNNLSAQTTESTLSVYLDCRSCNETFIRSEIDFVSFVRDQSVAEVQLLVTSQGTGGGGRQYTLEFLGLAEFSNVDNKLIFISPQSDTNELRRNKLVKYIKLGLINYLTNKEVFDQLEVSFIETNGIPISLNPGKDPWNGWNFNVGLGYDFSGEQTQGQYEIRGDFRSRKITDDWKIRADYSYRYNNRFFVEEDSQGEDSTTYYIRTSQSFFGLVAKSFSDHWTAGAYLNGLSSTQQNYDLRFGIAPSIEYSVFPYSEFARRAITFRYGILAQQNQYTDTTVFGQKEELLFRQDLNIEADFTQPWGGIYGRIDAGNYLHDFTKNSFQVRFRINMRVTRSFSFFVSGRYEKINDQLSISGAGLSQEDILLNLKDQATSYKYGGYVGIDFNFGSVYSNAVNSRF